MNSIAKLFEEQIKDLHSAESQLLRALPKMIQAASSEELTEGLSAHLEQTSEHIRRLEEIAETSGFKPKGKVCHGMKGLLEEATEALESDGNPFVIDAAIIAAAQRVEHYEISGYGTVRCIAKTLRLDTAVKLLDRTFNEEVNADQKLTEVAEKSIYPQAPMNDGDDDVEEDPDADHEPPAKSHRTPNSNPSADATATTTKKSTKKVSK